MAARAERRLGWMRRKAVPRSPVLRVRRGGWLRVGREVFGLPGLLLAGLLFAAPGSAQTTHSNRVFIASPANLFELRPSVLGVPLPIQPSPLMGTIEGGLLADIEVTGGAITGVTVTGGSIRISDVALAVGWTSEIEGWATSSQVRAGLSSDPAEWSLDSTSGSQSMFSAPEFSLVAHQGRASSSATFLGRTAHSSINFSQTASEPVRFLGTSSDTVEMRLLPSEIEMTLPVEVSHRWTLEPGLPIDLTWEADLHLVADLPEPGIGLALAVGLGGLSWVGRRSGRPSRSDSRRRHPAGPVVSSSCIAASIRSR